MVVWCFLVIGEICRVCKCSFNQTPLDVTTADTLKDAKALLFMLGLLKETLSVGNYNYQKYRKANISDWLME